MADGMKAVVRRERIEVGQRWRVAGGLFGPARIYDVVRVHAVGGYNLATLRCGEFITVVDMETMRDCRDWAPWADGEPGAAPAEARP